jgi:sugar/nucleoside kinase (ribokinase family)
MDLVARASRIPRIGQTLIGTGFDTTPGGKGANQAVAAARLGYPTVQMVGAVGNDDVFGQALLDNLGRAGVGTAAVEQTGLALRRGPDSSGRERRKQHRGGSRRQRQGGSRSG